MSSAVDQISYEDLYERWERGNWRATEIDFSADVRDWHETFGDLERRAALWNYAMFFHGEDSVAENLSPYIDAAPRQEQKYFLATQQVDEARHAVFFSRFMQEVVQTGDSIAASLEATRPQLTWGFKKTFERLDRMADELRADPSIPQLAAGITLYHLIVEATLAQPGQHFIQNYLEKSGLLPGFYSGMLNVAGDEQRHIGFGVKLLSDLIKQDPECRDAIGELLREVMPYTMAVFIPPNWDRGYTECFGFSLEDIFAEGGASLESKLRAAGIPAETIPGFAFPTDISARERGERAIKMVYGNLLGEKNGPPSHDPEVVALLFDLVRRSVDPREAPTRKTTIQWDFADHDPWFLALDNGTTRVEQARHPAPDVTLGMRFEDWVDIAAGRLDPKRAMATGRMRPRGSVRALWAVRHVFGK